MQRKRRKSEDTEDKRVCMVPSVLQTPVAGPKELQPTRFELWGVDEVVSFLSSNGFDKYASIFEEHEVKGRHLASLDREDLINMKITTVGAQKDLLKLFSNLYQSEAKDLCKVFNDPIHGHIELHPLLVKIIDTPQFQRLRYIKQLGGCYFVFPGASHNRFEHSIGVCHLAGELVETLKERQPKLGITDKDVLCVKMAGLCHDLGHGPFSHLYDGLFIPEARPGCKWKHEDASVAMFDHLIRVNDLQSSFDKYDITDTDLVFVKEQIAGPIDTEQCSSQMQSDHWPYIGRGVEKGFLYEIVANKKNGIDVDKWDYFARDCHHLGIMINFDYHRFMKFVRVIPVSERLQICTRDKEVANLYDMFHTRNTLHRRAYQHKTSNVIELMICEAFLKADNHLEIAGKDSKPVKLSQCIDDMHAYTNLNDHVFHQILYSTNPNLKESQEILNNILKRKLYKCIGQTQPAVWKKKIPKQDHKRLATEIVRSLEPSVLTGNSLPTLTADDLLVDVVTFDYGMRSENPIDHVRFYLKHEPQKAVKVRKDQVSHMLPGSFTEQQVRVYCRRQDELSLKAAWQYFISWCRNQDCITPKGAHLEFWDDNDVDITPYNTPVGTPVKDNVTVVTRGEVTPVKKLLSYQDDTS